ncbi:hypothetical protein FRC00_007667 [Tulasnella sp. 408]|nr:hypothetical protein FRC00_007667 [Tulasnella sp. 408]
MEKAYVTGPKETGRAIVIVYDVIGYSSQAIQGADILAWSANAHVIVPDLLQGDFADHSWIPPDTPEKLQRWQRWYAERGNPLTYLEPLASVADTLRNGGAQKIGLVGFCWGGKVATLAGTEANGISAVVAVHPGMVDPNDATVVECDAFMKALESKPFAAKNDRKRYDTMHHGWAAARGDLNDEQNLKEFQDVYGRIATFIDKIFDQK